MATPYVHRSTPPPIPPAARKRRPFTLAELAERRAEADTRTHQRFSGEGLSLEEREAEEIEAELVIEPATEPLGKPDLH